MKVIAINGDTVKEALDFAGRGSAIVNLIAEDKGATTLAKWQMIMEIGFLHRAPMLFMNMDKMMGPDFEKGLANLKTALESAPNETPATATYEVKELEWPETTYLGSKTEAVEFANIPTFLGSHFSPELTDLTKNNVKPESAPSGIYFSYDETKGKAEMAAVFKVTKGTKMKGYESYHYPASNVLHVAYYGDYSKTKAAHDVIGQYMKDKKLEYSVVIEEYVTDPGVEKDMSKWLTNIYYVLK
ncbi:MAG: hypothetical protein H0W61_14505 [Bacteroidetes bacterium]|nr:hypothetical protein [Bacteroidota bacterium]